MQKNDLSGLIFPRMATPTLPRLFIDDAQTASRILTPEHMETHRYLMTGHAVYENGAEYIAFVAHRNERPVLIIMMTGAALEWQAAVMRREKMDDVREFSEGLQMARTFIAPERWFGSPPPQAQRREQTLKV